MSDNIAPAPMKTEDPIVALQSKLAAAEQRAEFAEAETEEAKADAQSASDRATTLEKQVTTNGKVKEPAQKKPRKKAVNGDDPRMLDKSRPFAEIRGQWAEAPDARYEQGGAYFNSEGIEIMSLRQSGQEITDPEVAKAEAKARADKVNLRQWAEGIIDYAFSDVSTAIRDRFNVRVTEPHDAIDVLIANDVVRPDRQTRTRISNE